MSAENQVARAAPFIAQGAKVFARDGAQAGVATGNTHHCRLHGCNGLRVTVRWSDGKFTYPCSKGMSEGRRAWRIL